MTSLPRLVNLILYSPSPEYDQMMELVRIYMKTTQVPYFFYCFKLDIESPFLVEQDILYIRGNETYLPGILEKTIEAIEISMEDLFDDFDYLVRTNISTVCNVFLLKYVLQKHPFDYGGSKIFNLSWIDPLCGIVDKSYFGLNYISGTGIVLSKKACCLLLSQKDEIKLDVIDDVSIGLFFRDHEIIPVSLESIGYNLSTNSCHISSKILFYRSRTHNRLGDIRNMKIIINKLMFFRLK
jgi:hypothetical protein